MSYSKDSRAEVFANLQDKILAEMECPAAIVCSHS